MNKYNYTYQTKNLINEKTYIGVHSTNNLNDGYMGSGYRLLHAFKKYGKQNFITTILCFFDTREEMLLEEAWLVDEKWVKDDNNYNVILGGNICGRETFRNKTKEEMLIIFEKIKLSNIGKKHTEEHKNKISQKTKGENNPNYGKKHSDLTKKLISDKAKSNANRLGISNIIRDEPINIRKRSGKNGHCTYEVRISTFHKGNITTLEEAIILRDSYMSKLKTIKAI